MCGARRRSTFQAIASRGGSEKAGFRTWRSAHARIGGRREVPMRGGCARRIGPRRVRDERLVLGRNARCGCRWITCGAPGCGGRRAGRSQVAVALRAAVGCDRSTVPVLGASCCGRVAGGLEGLHVAWAIVEGWRSIATRDEFNLLAGQAAIKVSMDEPNSVAFGLLLPHVQIRRAVSPVMQTSWRPFDWCPLEALSARRGCPRRPHAPS